MLSILTSRFTYWNIATGLFTSPLFKRPTHLNRLFITHLVCNRGTHFPRLVMTYLLHSVLANLDRDISGLSLWHINALLSGYWYTDLLVDSVALFTLFISCDLSVDTDFLRNTPRHRFIYSMALGPRNISAVIHLDSLALLICNGMAVGPGFIPTLS